MSFHLRQNLTGQVFGYLTVVEFAGINPRGYATWKCRCICGNSHVVSGMDLRRGSTVSCGCYRKQLRLVANLKHGLCQSRTYKAWQGMLARCSAKTGPSFRNYVSRGIKVCKRWDSFARFLEDMGMAPVGLTLDRKNNNRGYCKSNCRWATTSRQLRNTRYTKWLTIGGCRQPVIDWAEQFGLKPGTVLKRLKNGWSPREALSPLRKSKWTITQ